MAVISVDYNEGGDLKYKSLTFNPDTGPAIHFNRGFGKDWYDLIKKILMGHVGKNYFISYSSSVDHYVSDTGLYDSKWLTSQNNEGTLWDLQDTEEEGSYELFVPVGWNGTWKDLKDKYDGK